MHDSAPFLDAIAAAPDDDLPRLIYADYLEELGEASRAEFIRIQVEMARSSTPALVQREQQLLKQHVKVWELPDVRGKQFFRRGFVEALWTTAERLLDQPEVLNLAPLVRELRIVNASDTPTVERLARLPGLDRLHTLDLRNNHFGIDRRILRFFRAANMPNLKTLNLYMNTIDSDDLMDLIDSPIAPQLLDLDVSGNAFGQPGLKVLATTAKLKPLQTLTARADEMAHYDCLHAQAGTTLANSRHLRLKKLDLADHYLGDDGLAALVRTDRVANLTHLGLAYNEIGLMGEAGLEALLNSAHLGQLKELNLSGNVIPQLIAPRLAEWPHLEQIHWIDLREAMIDEDSRRLLEASPWAGKFLFG
jgi:uncharacterized protein (TIGR02996 family)